METLGELSSAQHYFAEIEEAFSRLRQRPLLLAPRDVALVKSWFELGVPLRVVLKGLELFFARESRRESPRRLPASLAYCEQDVLNSWEEWRLSRIGSEPSQAVEGGPDDILRAHLAASVERLERAGARAKDAGHAALVRAVRAVLRRLKRLEGEVGTAPPGVIEAELILSEEKLARAARKELAAELATLAASVSRELAPMRGSIEERAYDTLRRKAEDRALFVRLGLPRLVLFSF